MTGWEPPDHWRYESAIAEVELIIQQIESGDLDLDEVVQQFQTAAHTLKQCETFLQEKQVQVDLIIEQLTDKEEVAAEDEDLVF